MAQYTQASNTQDVPTIEDPDTATPIVPVVPPAGVPTGTATDYLNVRTGPSTYYPILGVAPPGATSEITGRSSDGAWWQVKVPTQYSASGLGWVSAGYVIAQNAEDVPVVTAPPPPPTVVPTPSAPPQLTCSLLSQTPANETQFSADQPFTASWTVENTGNVEWTNYDVQFVGALNNVRLHTGADVYDLEYFPDPGQTYTFSTPMMAPFSAGRYGEEWQIVGEGGVACQFSVYITVP
jgi:uncharacterized protein YraI